MKICEPYEENDMPWDVKLVKIELGDHGDEWLEVEVFSDKNFRITFKNVGMKGGDNESTVEEMHMDVARRLRDFLNYAVPNVELSGREEKL